MLYRLFTATEEKYFSDPFELDKHLRSAYGDFTYQFSGDVYNLYNARNERFGYWEIIQPA